MQRHGCGRLERNEFGRYRIAAIDVVLSLAERFGDAAPGALPGAVRGFMHCLALGDLSGEEVLAIAEHEHIPEMAAVELGNYLVHTPEGELRIKSIIRDDIARARKRGERNHELALRLLLRNFVLNHPHCEERHRAAAASAGTQGCFLSSG